ncbi:MAG: RagB/SusD family nutrient uptake outer membrane protein [Prevotella sp.]|nr:RagB/SusD family nutrient uptake outer membrane protein [Prevotella sp.]
MKNKIYNSLIIAAGLLSLTACDVLDQEPSDYVPDSGLVTDAASATTVLNGAYHKLGVSDYYGGGYYVIGISLSSDNTLWFGSYNFLEAYDTHTIQADNTSLLSAWYAIYSTVNQANNVIHETNALPASAITDSERKRIVAEGTVIRSLALFDLARTWGNIPVIKEPTASPTQFNGVKQTEARKVYEIVRDDLLAVRDDLSEASQRSNVYVSKQVADAFLARVYLYLEDYDNAERYATQVIESGYYELVPISDFYTNKQTKESIWELAYSSSVTNEWFHYWQRAGSGRGEVALTKETYDLLNDPLTGGDRAQLTTTYTDGSNTYYLSDLYHRSANNDDPTYLFRLAEQYLIRAEARANSGASDGLEKAISDLDAVRSRSNVADYQGEVTKEAVLDAIALERRIEFAAEPHRWFDLIRTGKAEEVLGIPSFRKLFPIPATDKSADSDLEQNPGY